MSTNLNCGRRRLVQGLGLAGLLTTGGWSLAQPALVNPCRAALAGAGLLPAEAVADLEAVREHNPLLFDLALKRTLAWRGKAFPTRVFEMRRFFAPSA